MRGIVLGGDQSGQDTAARIPSTWMYHSVSDVSAPDPHRVKIRSDRLDYQLRCLRRLGVQGVSVSEALSAARRGSRRRLVALTFDDGYADFRGAAMPILEKHGMTATVYVVAGRLDMTNDWDGDAPQVPLMSATDVRDAAAAGHEVGSHGMTHLHLAGAPLEQLREEVNTSRAVLEDVLQGPVRGFCFPYGSHDDAAVAEVMAAGYEHACVTDDYRVPGVFRLPRYYVGQGDGAVRLVAKEIRHRLRQGGPRS